MKEKVRVTVLVENTAAGRGMLGEHGLAYWIETGSTRVLFDTGQTSRVLLNNGKHMGIDVAKADAIVLSHGHYDHAGGLEEVLRGRHGHRLLLHPGALVRRFSRGRDGTVRDVGVPPPLDERFLHEHAGSITFTSGVTPLGDKLWVSGEVPRTNDFEDTGGDFFLDEACERPDPIVDDQALFFDTRDGIVVLLGCGHAGVVNTLRYVQRLTDGRPIHAVMGGMHLVNASPDRLDRTVEALGEMDVALVAPAHCTGARAKARLWSEFPDRWEDCSVASRFEFSAATAI
jgi:7,8-dihydropterin-6-yl-methyl-4-(beta-D-ribofuranosyl)aminobenzene 5'-phosphate synthase